jgi:long-subunit fatty acid transport protein
VLFPPTLCLSHTTAGGFALGVGVGMPLLGRRDWDPGWTGRLHAIRSEHRALVIAPGIAVPLSSTLSVGAAMDFTVGRVNFARRVSLPGGEATLSLLADGMTAIGYHVGAVLEVSRIVQLGASFRAPVTMRSDNVRGTYGDAAAGVTPAPADEELQVEITRPSAVQAQLLFQPFGFLRIAGSIERESWGGRATRIVRRSTGETIADWTAGWGSSLTYAAGVEILAGDVALRFSMRRATSAAEPASLHPALPDADGILYGGGFGYRVDAGLFLDVGFTHAESADAPVTASRLSPPLSGTYTLTGTMVGLTITYVWNTND